MPLSIAERKKTLRKLGIKPGSFIDNAGADATAAVKATQAAKRAAVIEAMKSGCVVQ